MWSRLADLPLVVEDYERERLDAPPAFGHDRATELIRLAGGGSEGVGEDITAYVREEGFELTRAPALPLAGEWTLAGFSDHLASVEQWSEPPKWDLARNWRNWGYESAALDLALRQAGRALQEALGLEPGPVRFVNSFGLGEPPQFATLQRRLDRYPGMRFKLDAEATWDEDLLRSVAATGAVDTIDFKGQYGREVKDPDALVVLYERVVEIFPDAILEDPHDLPGVAEVLEPHLDRVSYDAPIRSAADVDATSVRARIVNVKPSRIGGIRTLLELYAHCRENGLRMYGGGMGELGPARGQIELLASLFHPDAPNDVAPSGFNDEDPPAGLPSSPLEPRPAATGFRWASD
jgi:L-alanine-DL-glutamate epimerase-like enolase superfamily enzyme